jgi:predicted acetyltransferase
VALEIGPYSGKAKPYIEAVSRAFSEELREADAEIWSELLELDRSLAAQDGGRVVGTASAFTFELAVPGATLPAAGVTMVGVHATHRRRGILRQLMRLQLDDVRERGEPVAILWASEGIIYQRFGYGPGTRKAKVSVERARNAFRRPHTPDGAVRFVDVDEAKAAFPALHDALWRDRPGDFGRSDAYWRSEFFHAPEQWRRGLGPPIDVVHETDGAVDGYARYAVRAGKDEREIDVAELMAATPSARLDLWRFLLDVDLIAKVEAWNLPLDDPLPLAVAEPRRLNWTVGDALWLRLVDLPAALAGRRYAGSGELVIDVGDEFCPWNAGRWRLAVSDGAASVSQTDAPPDLALETADLAATYLGAFTFAQLAGALRLRECNPGAIARGDALFRTDTAPFCPGTF